MKSNEQDNTTHSRIMPVKRIYKGLTLNLAELESLREFELEQRKIRVWEYHNKDW